MATPVSSKMGKNSFEASTIGPNSELEETLDSKQPVHFTGS